MRVITIFGTRPEAIKMAPVILELQKQRSVETIVCVTAQHRHMLDEALAVFGISPQFDLDIMRSDQSLAGVTSTVLNRLTPLLDELKPDRAIVHGDTTTTFAASMACFYRGVPVGHVEAGLRTGNIHAPWPEEFNRRATDIVADLLWAPTAQAAAALEREGAPTENVRVTGNTVIDALRIAKRRLDTDNSLSSTIWQSLPHLDPGKRLILVTGHRRESFGGGLANMCAALNQLAARPDVELVWPVHPNPSVQATVHGALLTPPNVHLIQPLNYLAFLALMIRSTLIITDSGGIQEEAPALAKPVLVTRTETERPEAVQAGTARLVGTDTDAIVGAASDLLDHPPIYERMAKATNPFGDGHAASRIVADILERRCTTRQRPRSTL